MYEKYRIFAIMRDCFAGLLVESKSFSYVKYSGVKAEDNIRGVLSVQYKC